SPDPHISSARCIHDEYVRKGNLLSSLFQPLQRTFFHEICRTILIIPQKERWDLQKKVDE
ncbi:MAG: hypothetical protein WCR76_02185, partial [Sphaerochaetaceae bacterium]